MSNRPDERTIWIVKNVLPHERAIRAWLSHRRVHDFDIDDVIQEMYAKIGGIKDLAQIRSPRSYAFQVAQSILLSHLRRSKIVSISPEGDLEGLNIPSAEASPEEALVFKDEMAIVASVVDQLPARTREVLLLRRIEGLSQKETAARLAVSEKAIEKHMTHALYVLMKQFGRGGKSASQASKLRQAADHDAHESRD